MKYLRKYEDKILDNILDKIMQSGKDSLSPLEKEYLDRFSKDQSTKDVQQEMNKKEYVDEIGPYEAKLVLTNVEDVDNYDEPNYGVHKKWNGTLYIGDKEYDGYIGFKNDDYLYGYFENIYEELEGFHYEIDQFCENAFYSLIGLIGVVENFFLSESRVEDIEKKFSDKLGGDILNFFKRNDPTENKAYFHWLCDRWFKYRTKTDIKFSPSDVIKLVTRYNNIKQKLEKKEIDKIGTIEELADIVYSGSELNIIKDEDSKDVKILYDSNEWIVFIPYTSEISRKYGDKSWCTVYSPDEHFERHFGEHGALIYFMNKLNRYFNFALEQTSKNLYDFWNIDDEKKLENEPPEEIKEFIAEYLNRGHYTGPENDLVVNFENIMAKVPESKLTEYKYKKIVAEKFKENGIEWISKNYGTYVIFSAIDILPTYKNIMNDIVEKIISNSLNKETNIVSNDPILFYQTLEVEFPDDTNKILKEFPRIDTEYKVDALREIGVKNILNKIKHYDNFKQIMKKYINEYFGGTGYLEEKFYEAFGNKEYIIDEGAELIEKYMDWNVLIDFLIPEMDEEDYFEYLNEIE